MYLKRLKELREDHDLLQKQVAIALKITRQQYGFGMKMEIEHYLLINYLYCQNYMKHLQIIF